MKFKFILLYALALAGLTFLLNLADYKFYVRDLEIEVYLILVALIFAGLGAWLAYTLASNRNNQSADSHSNHHQFTAQPAKIHLSERETEVLMGIAEGLSNQEIGEKLNISLSTVKTHTSSLFSKLGVQRRTQAIIKAQNLGVITHSVEDYSK